MYMAFQTLISEHVSYHADDVDSEMIFPSWGTCLLLESLCCLGCAVILRETNGLGMPEKSELFRLSVLPLCTQLFQIELTKSQVKLNILNPAMQINLCKRSFNS
jgi:hypothetical protein